MEGFLFVDKPAGITSHDVVDQVRRLLRTYVRTRSIPKVGHAGTLDPLATGLLIIGVGGATKMLQRLLKLPKTYEAEVTLGATSTTDDAEGPLTETPAFKFQRPKHGELERVLRRLTGEIEQVPPAYSAVKLHGVRAHRRARRGERVSLTPRRVTIKEAVLLSYEFPRTSVRWTVSSGTYIRALARDLGVQLGTGAYLSALRRTSIGPFRLSDAVPLAQLTAKKLPDALHRTEDIVRLAPHTVQ